MGDYAETYSFPEKLEVTNPFYCARDIAEPDDSIDKMLWRKDNTSRVYYQDTPRPGEVHQIARAELGWDPHGTPIW